jgi:hypothetical protein
MPAMINATLIRRTASADSLNSRIPNKTVPTDPTPTQTPYAVPTGSPFMAMPNNPRLTIMANAVPIVGQSRVKPSVYLSPIAHATSNKPATTSNIHATSTFTSLVQVVELTARTYTRSVLVRSARFKVGTLHVSSTPAREHIPRVHVRSTTGLPTWAQRDAIGPRRSRFDPQCKNEGGTLVLD